MDKVLRTHFKQSLEADRWIIMWLEGIKCCMPTVLTGHVRCFTTFQPLGIAKVHIKMEGTKMVQLNFSMNAQKEGNKKAAGCRQGKAAKENAKDVAKKPPKAKGTEAKNARGRRTKETTITTGTDEPPPEVADEDKPKPAADDNIIKLSFEQSEESLKTMEWAEDMDWVFKSASQLLTASCVSLTQELPVKEECAWRAGMHLVFTKSARYFTAGAGNESMSTSDDTEYTSWRILKKAICLDALQPSTKSLEIIQLRPCVVYHLCCVCVLMC